MPPLSLQLRRARANCTLWCQTPQKPPQWSIVLALPAPSPSCRFHFTEWNGRKVECLRKWCRRDFTKKIGLLLRRWCWCLMSLFLMWSDWDEKKANGERLSQQMVFWQQIRLKVFFCMTGVNVALCTTLWKAIKKIFTTACNFHYEILFC